MLWIKRNLVLVIGGVVALGLLVAGGLYFSSGLQKNRQMEESLERATNDLIRFYMAKPFPAQSNISRARELVNQTGAAVDETKKHFVPIPFQNVRDQQFKTLLDNTIADLARKADQVRVELPETNYAFTFKAQKTLVKFAEGSFPALPERLAEIKTICSILFDAKCNLLNLRRERLTTDDAPGSTEFTELKSEADPMTGMVLVPFEVVVSCFSKQLSTLLQDFARSPHGLLVKVLAVEPLSGGSPEVKEERTKSVVTAVPGSATLPFYPRRRAPPPAAAASPEASDNPVVLIEQSLKVTLLIRVVKSGESPGEPRARGPRGRPPRSR